MRDMETQAFLKDRVALFAGVTDENLAALAATASVSSFGKGQSILFRGATVDGLHVVLAGRVAVMVKLPNKGVVPVAELGPGEVFGETSIVEMGTAGAAVKAVEDGTEVLVIPQEAFRRVLQQDEAFAVRVNQLIASRKAAPAAVPA